MTDRNHLTRYEHVLVNDVGNGLKGHFNQLFKPILSIVLV